ncbi:insecticidal delta-endotoxin Cry8Ea1 family protein [Bacillus mycoides]|nr:insecticidal delta-endotoxin Cry8Ea1 family protein [Bacillus mycoides]
MNTYQYKNEYEILDALPNYSNTVNTYSRYPLANNSQASLQNTNYKDWLNMCPNNNILCTPRDIDINSVSATIGAVGAILSLIPGPGEAIGFVLATFTSLIPYLWPSDTKTIWGDFTKQGLQLFRPELGRDAIEIIGNNVQSGYNTLKDMMQNFETRFATWKIHRTRANATLVISAFDNVSDQILRLKNDFLINPENKPAFLNLYAQTANFDLILYQRGAVYGDDWVKDINNRSIFSSGSAAYYECLKLKIVEYTNNCAETYRNSLNILKNKSNISWDTYNKYRREVTLGALDLVALFPNYDICIYPIQTKTELTRKIYMPSFYLQALGQSGNLESLENQLTHPPSLFTWLNELNLYTISENFNPALRVSSLSGLQAKYRYTQNPTILPNPAQGITNGTPIPIGLNNLFIYKLSMSQYHDPNDCYPIAGISDMTFYKSDYNGNASTTQTYRAGRNSNNVIDTFMNGPQNASSSNNISIKQTNHILSDIKMNYSRIGGIYPSYTFGYSFAWTHTSVDPDNLIVPNRITQIPAVKADSLTSPARVIAGPGHTGGDLVALLNDGTQAGRMQIRCKTGNFTGASRRYGLRMRYAANNEFTVNLSYSLQGGNPSGTSFVTERTFSRTNNIIPTDLNYRELKYKEYYQIIAMTLPANTVITISIQQANGFLNNQLIIDRIEFYPTDQGIVACELDQNAISCKI